jgi:glycosyltransferase involved in cell wall biosynthesis
MPLSLLEAMSYGNCCLTSDIAECAEVVEDKAVTFKKGDVSSLRDMLQKLCDDENLVRKYKSEASDFICQKYDWNIVVDQTVKLYQC